MPKRSSILRLPDAVREEIGRLRRAGKTIDEILLHLRQLDPALAPSRSALGRHVKHVDEVAAELLQHRSLAEALIERGLNLDDSRTARLNIALAQTVLAKLMLTDDGGLVQLAPKDAAFLAGAIKSLVAAAKSDSDRELAIKRSLAKDGTQAVMAAQGEAAAAGMVLTPDLVLTALRTAYGV
ncbi:MAG: DUF3486 family protein [Candidatus Symbiobacter sp.]|nr:DUF3486 family protein [Candidatus Symbiobacter sp.]